MKHKPIAFILAFSLLFSLFPTAAFASDSVKDDIQNASHISWTGTGNSAIALVGFETSDAELAEQIEKTGILNAQFNKAFTPTGSFELSVADTSSDKSVSKLN